MSDKTVIALGYFDCVHLGHRKVINSAKEFAESVNASLTVFTFNGNLKKATSDLSTFVYTLPERRMLLNDMGVENIYCTPVCEEFLNYTPNEFLDKLNSDLNIVAYFCGEDYTYGKNKSGNCKTLSQYAKSKNQFVQVIEKQLYSGKEISTSYIKELLKDGEIELANSLLVSPYFITETVKKDRKVGSKIGFPTVNLKPALEKQSIKNGVYKGHIFLNDNRYNVLINNGARPTFGLTEELIEAYIIGFNGDLYGKEITLYFDSFIRDIIKFDCESDLINQIKKDLQKVVIND